MIINNKNTKYRYSKKTTFYNLYFDAENLDIHRTLLLTLALTDETVATFDARSSVLLGCEIQELMRLKTFVESLPYLDKINAILLALWREEFLCIALKLIVFEFKVNVPVQIQFFHASFNALVKIWKHMDDITVYTLNEASKTPVFLYSSTSFCGIKLNTKVLFWFYLWGMSVLKLSWCICQHIHILIKSFINSYSEKL